MPIILFLLTTVNLQVPVNYLKLFNLDNLDCTLTFWTFNVLLY